MFWLLGSTKFLGPQNQLVDNLPMDPIIRPFRSGDEDGINHVIKSVFVEYGWLWDPKTENRDTYEIEEHYQQRGGGFWVLADGDEIIGTLAIRGKEGDLCGLHRVYLLANNRGKGHGRSMFRFAIDRAKEMGYRRMEIWSDKTLDVSHIMYKNAGATLLGDRSVFDPEYGAPYDEWGYLLDLNLVESTI